MREELVEVQTQVAFQEQTINELNEVLTRQQSQMDRLELELKVLRERVEVLEDVAPGDEDDQPPPHY